MTAETAHEPTPTLAPMPPLARQLIDWADSREASLVCTAYLTTGAVIATDAWEYDLRDGLLMYQGDGGTMHLLDPTHIYAIHCGPPSERDPGFTLNGAKR